MELLQRVRLSRVPWWPFLIALALTAFGVLLVNSACYDPEKRYGLGRETTLQLGWWAVGLVACGIVMHVPLATWKALSLPAWITGLGLQFFMMAAAGTALVPAIKGQHNWLVLGGLRLQPSELIKLATLLMCSRVASGPGFNPQSLRHVLGVVAIAGVPAVLLAREDLGSALTFVPLLAGVLVMAGARASHLGLLAATLVLTVAAGIASLPRTGPKAYQWQRIQAWRNPEDYALAEAFQTLRSVRSIGSGQFLGKGYAAGDQNRLGWLPEKHTDLIFAVCGEEFGFVGSVLLLLGFLALAGACLAVAARCRDPFARVLCAGVVSLICGQMAVNVAVATGLMPVTGITLPFISYGGSSLLATWAAIGLVLCAGASSSGSTLSTRR